MHLKTLSTLIAAVLISACSNSNTVNVIAGEGTITPLKTEGDFEDRYRNLYPGDKEYPTTCTDNCYEPSELLICDDSNSQCQYQAEQIVPATNIGFIVRWLGHAGFYIQSPNGEQLLFDPVKDQFDSPVDLAFKLAGGCYRKPGFWLTKSELESVEAVMYSHIHYDHFNKADIEEMGRQPRYLTPLGMADNFPTGGFNISEMAWYAKTNIGDLAIHALPAHHFSSRVLVPFIYEDNDKDLWNGWLLEQNGSTLFFAGDTGYSKHFSDIQQKYGDIDVCLMPIASYYSEDNPNWYRYVHTTPEDALTAAQELNCKIMIPWGYGNSTWKMGDRTSHSALLRLLHMHKKMDSKIPLYILNEGESIKL
ncbi:MBL fold metallo-hydrolase [Pseudoalteromonas sp. SK18]|uniref:MBL fold metallo-hydrolase n=1 Tax=Pseudoalteromonas sp. SK18 TaxID=1938366 RepID=UPI000977D9D1|nr:MBL fold metallo-hydrolase [Pseudoalteromonas sp. SK18]